jgi:hypothetical protein
LLLAGISAEPISMERALHAGDGCWNGREPRRADWPAARRTDTVAPIGDALQCASNLLRFLESHLIQTFQDFVVLQLDSAFRPIAVVRRPEISLYAPNPLQ